jgi:peptidoglycan hydrolase-like protein with peptidoglycan-binding domain
MSDLRFSAGDGLAPGSMEYYAHRAMMNNELSGGIGAYELGNAKLAASGPSFGPFQYDVGANAHGRELLENIATSAKDANNRPIMSAADVQLARDHIYKPFKDFTPQDQQAYDQLKPKLDAALASSQGIAAANADYLPRLQDKVAHVNEVVGAIPNAQNKAFVEGSPLAKMIILDTGNQYGGAVNDGLKEFMGKTKDDPAMNMPGRKPAATIKVEGEFGLEEMIRYKLETQYGQTDKGAKDVLRRVSNLVDAVGVDTVKASLSEEDRKFLDTGLKDYLKEHGRDTNILDAKELGALAQLSGHTVDRTVPQQPAHGNAHGASSAVLHEGSSGRDVTALQHNLAGLGLSSGATAGQYDATTKASVEAIQRAHGLTVDGKAGPNTRDAIKSDLTEMQAALHDLGYKGNGRELVADGAYGPASADALRAFQREHGMEASGLADEATRTAVRTAAEQARAPAQPTTPQSNPTLASPDHEGHSLYTQARQHVHALDTQLGRTPDTYSDNLAAGLAVQARADGLQRIDAVALSTNGDRLWAVEQPGGRSDHLFDRQTSVSTNMATVPLEQSSQQWAQASEQARVQTEAQSQARAQSQQNQQEQSQRSMAQ